jgi:hypothetical protein
VRTALGWSVHTGWAVVVAVGREASMPVLLHRERMAFVPDELPRQAYHAAEQLPLGEAGALIGRVESAARAGAAEGVGRVVRELAGRGHEVVASVVLGDLHELPPLDRILSSHSLLHMAEGVLYREVVVDASEAQRLVTTLLAEVKRVGELAAEAQGWTVERCEGWLLDVGRAAGPPWQKDHKQAALAALAALGAG